MLKIVVKTWEPLKWGTSSLIAHARVIIPFCSPQGTWGCHSSPAAWTRCPSAPRSAGDTRSAPCAAGGQGCPHASSQGRPVRAGLQTAPATRTRGLRRLCKYMALSQLWAKLCHGPQVLPRWNSPAESSPCLRLCPSRWTTVWVMQCVCRPVLGHVGL